jgi:hypothetical protein
MRVETDDPLVLASSGPAVSDLSDLLTRCSPVSRGYDRCKTNDDTRYCRWANQTTDGKKHGTTEYQAQPWEGASDTRVFLADDIVEECADIKELAFNRALLQTQPVEIGDLSEAAQSQKLLKWVVGTRMAQQLSSEVPLSAQYWDAYGWVVLHVVWERQLQLRNAEVTLQQLVAAGEQVPGLVSLIMDPEAEDQAAEILAELYRGFVLREVQGVYEQEVPTLGAVKFRRYVRELRTDGKTTVPMPYLRRNDPCVISLKPWDEVFIPPDTADIQKASAVFRREWLTEVELRERVETWGYDSEWVEQALKFKGSLSAWTTEDDIAYSESVGTAFGFLDNKSGRVEVIHGYTRRLDANGVPAIWCTVFHPQVQGLYGLHEMQDYHHGLMPFVVGRREHNSRRICDSRGVPELVWCYQREEKVQHDSIVDNTSFATVPPILVPMRASPILSGGKATPPVQVKLRYGPASEIPTRPGAEPKFMERPATPVVAFQVIELLERKVNRRFGRLDEAIPPALAQMKAQSQVNKFLAMWRQALRMVFSLTRQYLSPEEFARVTGVPPAPSGARDIEREYDLTLSFDVRELDPEHVAVKLAAVKDTVLPVDVGGAIDRTRLVGTMLRAIDPSLIPELMQDQASAGRKLFERVQQEIALMSLGNEPIYTDGLDPTSRRQLEYAQQIIFGDGLGRGGNPRYQQQLQSDERFRSLLDNWQKNKMQSIVQEENKMVGRTGVKPVGGGVR